MAGAQAAGYGQVAAPAWSAEGLLVSTLEGGYDLAALARSVHRHLEALAS